MVSALADTGAQSNFQGWKDFLDTSFGKKDLLPVSITIRATYKKLQLTSYELSKSLLVEHLQRMMQPAVKVYLCQ